MTQERAIKWSAALILLLACMWLVRYSAGIAAGGMALWTAWDAAGPAISAGQNERPAAVKLSDYNREDDFPSIAAGRNGEAWLVWSSYSALKDEIRLRKYADGRWYAFTRVPGGSGDVWMPQVAVDQQNRVWVVWSQQVEKIQRTRRPHE